MRFSDKDIFERAFSGEDAYYNAQELDAYMDFIEDDVYLFNKIRAISLQQSSAVLRMFPEVEDANRIDNVIESIAKKINSIDYPGHSGGSFMCLSLTIKAIVDAGGRDSYLSSKLDSAVSMHRNN